MANSSQKAPTPPYPELQSLAAALACLSVLYLLLPKLPRGLPRALCVAPTFPILAMVPFSTRSHILRAVFAFMFLWLCPCKLLLRCWDVFPDYPGDGLLYFLCSSVMPLRVKGRSGSPEGGSLQGLRAAVLRLLQFLLVLALGKISTQAPGSGWLHHFLYCLLLYVSLEWVLCMFSGLISVLLGLELYPFFHKPWLATSLSDFWGRRWNCLASFMLRETVYMPTLYFLSGRKKEGGQDQHPAYVKSENGSTQRSETCGNGAKIENREMHQNVETKCGTDGQEFQKLSKTPLPARGVAMLASFTASGLIHELIFCCITQTHATAEVTLFFILNGVATVFEVFIRRRFGSSRNLPEPIAILCTLSFLYVSSAWLFMPPVVRTGADERILAELFWMQDAVVNRMSGQRS